MQNCITSVRGKPKQGQEEDEGGEEDQRREESCTPLWATPLWQWNSACSTAADVHVNNACVEVEGHFSVVWDEMKASVVGGQGHSVAN